MHSVPLLYVVPCYGLRADVCVGVVGAMHIEALCRVRHRIGGGSALQCMLTILKGAGRMMASIGCMDCVVLVAARLNGWGG